MLAKIVLSVLLTASVQGVLPPILDDISSDSCASLVQVKTKISNRMRPKTQWDEPLSPEEVEEFEKDMRTPIKHWLRDNPNLNSDYFVKFGIPRGYGELKFWNGVHLADKSFMDYRLGALAGLNMWKLEPSFKGDGKGPNKTWTIEGSTVTSHHLDHSSYLPDDAYCWTFGWLKGQGLDGSLMSNKSAWAALNENECNKIGEALAADFPEENHTVYRHVMWNRVWPNGLMCNEVGASCTPKMTKNNLREHVYRKCLFGFAPTEMAYCYQRARLVNGTDIMRNFE